MLTEDQVARFQERGFLNGGRLLDEERVERLREELDRVIREKDGPGPQPIRVVNLSGEEERPVWQIVNIWQAGKPFRDLLSERKILEEVGQLTGAEELRVWHDQVQYKPARHGGINSWHQDGPYWPILQPKDLVTAWIALDDMDESNGCMRMVPGSHKWGDTIDLLHSVEDYHSIPSDLGGYPVEVVRCPVCKGHVHYHHALTWHGSHENKSDRPRRAVAIHFMTGKVCYDSAGEHIMKEFVEVPDGSKLEGERFPLVWESEQVST